MTSDRVTHRTEPRRLGTLPSGQDLTVTVHRYVGGDGPTVYVQAAQHGIELNGPAALRRLHDRLVDSRLAGEVRVVPVANPPAFDHRSYTSPVAYDARSLNMNRDWPGDESGSFGERLVSRLWPLVVDADAAIDLHTGTPDMLSHVRYAGDDASQRLATVFGTDYRLVDESEPDASDTTTGKFRIAAVQAGIPAITAELSNSRTVAPQAATTGADGVERALQSLGVLSGSVAPADQMELRASLSPVTAADSGLFEPAPDVAVGESLTAETQLGRIYDPASFELLATPTTDEAGVVYSLARGTVIAGERVAALGVPS
ncbi:succinylglutamate desuccinylase/aspartoacylase family protein [Halosegnis sp.]|uniref:succinylglutamate desuccinylase/aspartoacylase family protein n=1 Tax=Halosegnis sp. TaxID=2864959 RepID=UPI0035D41925